MEVFFLFIVIVLALILCVKFAKFIANKLNQ